MACLGPTKRCDNGQDYLVKTYKGRVETEDINNAIRPLLQEHAKRCYLTWLYIDNNDGKLPDDDFQSFDDWSSSQPTSISAGSYLRRTYPSPAFHTAVYALNGEGGNQLDISRLANVNTFTPLQRFLLSTPSQRRCANTSRLMRNADVLQKGIER